MRPRLAARASCLPLLLAAHVQGGASTPPCTRSAERDFAVGDVTEVRDRKPPCRIEFRETGVRLRAVADGSRPDPGLTVLADSDGRFISANAPGWTSVISIWDSRGRHLSSFGREGEGPGELSARGALSLFIDGRNNLHVRDGAQGWSVFSSEHEFLRRVPANQMGGLPRTTIILDDGSAVASDGVLGGGRGNYFRMADSTGALIRAFGPVNPGSTGTGRRPITHAGGESFWAGPAEEGADAYVLEEWGVDGELRRTLRRNVPYRWNGNRETSPVVRQLHISQGGLLYVMVVRPTEDYARALSRGERVSREQRDSLTEVVLEVIDTRSGELLASEAYPASRAREVLPRGLFRGSLVGYRYVDDEGPLPFVEIIEVELVAR